MNSQKRKLPKGFAALEDRYWKKSSFKVWVLFGAIALSLAYYAVAGVASYIGYRDRLIEAEAKRYEAEHQVFETEADGATLVDNEHNRKLKGRN